MWSMKQKQILVFFFFFLGVLCLNVRAQCCHHFFCLKNSLITMRTETKGMKGLGEYNLVGFKSLRIFCKNYIAVLVNYLWGFSRSQIFYEIFCFYIINNEFFVRNIDNYSYTYTLLKKEEGNISCLEFWIVLELDQFGWHISGLTICACIYNWCYGPISYSRRWDFFNERLFPFFFSLFNILFCHLSNIFFGYFSKSKQMIWWLEICFHGVIGIARSNDGLFGM